MQQNDDPRNIFCNRRQEYADPTPTEQPRERPANGGIESGTNGGTRGGSNNGTSSGGAGKNGAKANTEAQNGDYEQKVRQMKELAAKYEREGEGQLVKDIVNNVIEQKAAGKLTNDQLIAFAKRVSPLLNAEQRTRLNGLLQELLKI